MQPSYQSAEMQRADVVNHLTMILHASLRSNEPPEGRRCPHRVDVVQNDDKSFVRRVLQHDGIGGLFGGIEPIIHITLSLLNDFVNRTRGR